VAAQAGEAGVPAEADVAVEVSFEDLAATDAWIEGQEATLAPLELTPYVPVVNVGSVPETALATKDYQLVTSSITTLEPAPLSPALATNFEGLPDAGWVLPPDTSGAAGPNHLMVMLNDRVRVQDKSGNVLSTVTLGTFWSPTGVSDVFDPKVIYDPLANRFVVTTCGNRRSATSCMLFGVSASSDPTGAWYLYKFDADSGDANWADYGNLGMNGKWFTFTCNMFTRSGDSFAGVSIWAIDKSSVVSGGAPRATLFFKTGVGSVISPCITYSSSEATQYMVNVVNGNLGGKGYVRIHTITGTATSPTYTASSLYPIGVAWSRSFMGAPQLGSTNKIATNDDRMMNAVLRNGRIWCTHTGALPASVPTHIGVVWWEIDPVVGTTVQSGYIEDPTGQMFYFFPSIAVNKNDEALIGFSGSSATTYCGAYYAYRTPSTPSGQTMAVGLTKAGVAPYGGSRWGDYSATCVDPANDTDLWTIQEYAALNGRWGTWWGKIGNSVDTTAPHVSSASAISGTTVRVTFNEAMADDAALVNPANYTFSGSVAITCSAATRVDSTQVDLTVNEMTGGAAYVLTVRSTAPAPSDVIGNIVDSGRAVASFTGLGAPPTAAISLLDASPTRADSVRFRILFSESVGTTFTAADVSATGSLATNAAVAVSGSGLDYTATITPANPDADGSLGITVGTSVIDAAGNAYAGGSSPTSYTIDNTPPGVSIGAPSSSVANSGPVNYTVSYIGATAIDLAAGDITLSRTGTANGSVSVSGTGTSARTVTLSDISGEGTISVAIAAGTATDAAGNQALAAGPSAAFTVDNTPPTLALSAPSAAATRNGPITYTATYDGATSISLSTSNITLNKTGSANATVGVSGTGTSRTITLSSVTGDGTLGITVAAGTAVDNAGNEAPGAGPSTAFTVDNTGPGVAISAPSASSTKSGPISYTITYTGASSVTLTTSQVTLNKTGSANASIAVSGTGASTRTVTLSSITGDGTLGVTIAPGTAVDGVGNSAPSAGPSTTVTVDNSGPGVTISAPSASVTDGGPITYTVTYSSAATISLQASNITLNKSGSTNASFSVSGSGTTRTVTLSSITGDGSLGFSIAAGTAVDTAGNLAAAAGPSPVVVVDNTAPAISVSGPSASLTRGGPISYTLSYTGASSITLAASNVTLNKTGSANGSVSVSGTGTSARTVTISSVTGDGTLGISVASGTATDDAGNAAGSASPSSTFGVDNTEPGIVLSGPSSATTRTGPVTFTVSYTGASIVTLTSENVFLNSTGTAAADISVSGTGASSRTITLSNVTGEGSLGVSVAAATARDAAGNLAPSVGPSTTVNVDIAVLSLSIGPPSVSVTKAGPISYTVTYENAASISLNASQVTVNSTGSAAGVVSVSGTGTASRTVTLSSLTGTGTLGISIAADSAVDAYGVAAPAAGPGSTATVDNSAPTATYTLLDSTPTSSDSVRFRVVFSESVSPSFSATDVTVTGTLAAGASYTVSGVDPTYTVTVAPGNPAADGTLGITVGSAVSDAAGNAYIGGSSSQYTVDNTAPSLFISPPSTAATKSGPVSYTVTYSDASSITLSGAHITLNTTGSATGSVQISGTGNTRTVTVSSIIGNGTLGISIAGGSATDAAGNVAGGAGPAATFTVDTTAPTVAIGSPSVTATKSGPVNYAIVYSGAANITLAASNVTLNKSGTANGSVAVWGSGSTRYVTISNVTGEGVIGISIASGTATDAAGNLAAGAGPSETFSVDKTVPTAAISAPSLTRTKSGPVAYTVTYGGASTISLTAADVLLQTTGTATASATVSGAGTSSRTITLLNVTGDGTIGVSIKAGTAADAVGNLVPAAGPSATFAADSTGPGIAIGSPSLSSTKNGPVSFTVTYTGAASVNLSASDVTLNATGTANGSLSVTGSGTSTRTVTLSNISGEGNLGISIASGTATDDVGNVAGGAGPSAACQVDNSGPSVAISAPSATLVRQDAILYTVTYANAASISLNAADITINYTGTARATAAVSGTGTTSRTVTLSGCSGDGTLGISIASGTAMDAVGNGAQAAGPSATAAVDNTAPAIVLEGPDLAVTRGGPVVYTATYTGAQSLSLTAAQVSLNKTGTANGTVSVSGTGVTRTIQIGGITGDGTLSVGIAAGTAVDTAGNISPAAGPSRVVTVDNTVPSIALGAPSVLATNGDSFTFPVTYGEASNISLSAGNVALITTGTANGVVTVSGTGNISRQVTVSNVYGDGTLGISIGAGTAVDAAGNTAGAAGPSVMVSADNTPPTINVGAPSATVTQNGPVTFTVDYTDARNVVLSESDVTLNATGTATGTVSVDGVGSDRRTVTIANISGDGTLGISIAAGTAVDAVGNQAPAVGPSSTCSVNQDVVSLALGAPSTTLTRTGPITIDVTYSNAASITLAPSDVTLTTTGDAAASIGVAGTGATRQITLSSISGNGTLSVSIAAGTATDASSTPAPSAGPSAAITVDNRAPVPTITLLDPNPTNLDAARFLVEFDEMVDGNFTADNVTVTGGLAAGATVAVLDDDPGFTVTVTPANPLAEGTLGITVAAGVADLAGNQAAEATSTAYSVDNNGPAIALSAPSKSVTRNGPVSYAVTYTDAAAITLATGDVNLITTGTANGTVSVTGSGAARTITISNTTGDGSLAVALAAGTAVDAVGNLAAATATSGAFTVDNTSPSVSSGPPSSGVTRSGPVRFPVSYAGATAIDLDTADIYIKKTGTATGIASLSGSGSEQIVTLSDISGDGTLSVRVLPATASDAAGNVDAGSAVSPEVVVDNTPPALTIGAPTQTVTQTGPVSFSVSYDGASAITLAAADITLQSTGTATGTVSISGTGTAARTVAISGISGEGTLGISIAGGTAVDAAGNIAPAGSPSATFNVVSGNLSVSIGEPSVLRTRTGPINFAVTYENANSISLAPEDVILTKTGTADAIALISGTGITSRTITLGDVTGDGTLSLSLAADTARDLFGTSSSAAGPTAEVVVDNTAPSVEIWRAGSSPTNADGVFYNVVFSEKVGDTFTAQDVTATGSLSLGATIGVIANDPNYTVTVGLADPSVDGTIGIALGTAISDLAGNSFDGAISNAIYTIDNTPPAPLIGVASASVTNTGPVSYSLTYPQDTTLISLGAGDIVLLKTGTVNATVALSGTGLNRIVTLSNISGNGALSFGVGPNTAVDSAGNAAIEAGPGPAVTVDNIGPSVTISPPSTGITNSGPASYTITYGGATTVTLQSADVSLAKTGTANATVSVSGSGAVRTVALTEITGDGTLGISIAAGTAVDGAGNLAGASGASATFRVDPSSIAVNLGAPSVAATQTGPVVFPVTYENASAVTLTTANVTLTTTGTATGTLSVSGTGLVERLITVDGVGGDGTLSVRLAAGTAEDAGGGKAPSAGPSATCTVDNTPPSILVNDPSLSATTAGPVTYHVQYVGADTVTLSAADIELFSLQPPDVNYSTLKRLDHTHEPTPGTAEGTITVTGTGTQERTITVSNITGDGVARIIIHEGTATDAAGNVALLSSPSSSFVVDNTAPTVRINQAPTQSDPVAVLPVVFLITFSEAVSGLDEDDITFSGTAASIGYSIFGAGAEYSLEVSSVGQGGTLVPSVNAGGVADPVGNVSAASTSTDNSVTFVDIAAAQPVLRIQRDLGTGNTTVSWDSEAGIDYDMYVRDAFNESYLQVATVTGNGGAVTWIDPAVFAMERYYQVRVGNVTSQNMVGVYALQIQEGSHLIGLPVVPGDLSVQAVLGNQLPGGADERSASRAGVWNGSVWETAWYYESGGTGEWRTGAESATMQFSADRGVWLTVPSGTGTHSVYLAGEVSPRDRTIALQPGMNFVAPSFPLARPIGDRNSGSQDANLWESGAVGSDNESTAIRFWNWTGQHYEIAWLADGLVAPYDTSNGRWYEGSVASDLTVDPGKGYWVQVRPEQPSFVWTYPLPRLKK
jgi:hypothetical protein